MKHFDVYLHPMLGIEAVKTGFSWTGFFFTWIWMLICRLWGRGIAVCVIAASTPFAAGVVGKPLFAGEDGAVSAQDMDRFELVEGGIALAGWFVISLIVGNKGNGWRRIRLMKRGFDHVKSVQAPNADAAVAKVSAQRKAEAAAP